RIGALQFVVWDKDIVGKDYLGELAIPLDELFKNHEPSPALSFDDPRNKEYSFALVSSRTDTESRGTLQLKIGFVPADPSQTPDYNALYKDILEQTRIAGLSLHNQVPTHGIGTAATGEEDLEDDGLSSDDEADSALEESDVEREQERTPIQPKKQTSTSSGSSSQKKTGSSFLSKPVLGSRKASVDSSAVTGTETPTSETEKKTKSKKKKHHGDYSLSAGHDIIGIVMIEVKGAEDLPKWKNMTRTGWDMDPCAVISFGKKVFRTRVIRHSTEPKWDEKLLFHVRRYEAGFKINFTILDWDKLSSNDLVGEVSLDLKDLMEDVPKPDPNTGIYPEKVATGDVEMKEFRLNIVIPSKGGLESKHSPVLIFKARYQPYAALRQQFWRQYLKQYDIDSTGTTSKLELTSMLDSLGSTLTKSTVDSFFTRYNKDPVADELTFDEAVQCLEDEVGKPRNERKVLGKDDVPFSTAATPMTLTETPTEEGGLLKGPNFEALDFSGPNARPGNSDEEILKATLASRPIPGNNQESNQVELATKLKTSGLRGPAADDDDDGDLTPMPGGLKKDEDPLDDADDDESSASEDTVERVINIKTCPLCHRPRMNSKAEVDIITHLAVCASGDWAKVDRIVVGNFVTASQAQRKWYTNVIAKVSAGSYQLGANSANIIVQNRMTGRLEEEKMQGYVRLGIRLLYKGAKSQMEGTRARKMLKSLSIKQGLKYDSPESAREIPPFIAFHNLNLDEILDPLESFKSFNEFFYRKLKKEARPTEEPDNPARLVSCADCRMMAFESVTEATKIWIKGREFSVGRLLGDKYKDQASKYVGGALGIFRLAPQDYHRFHVPVDGKIGEMTYISGEYYTVNPQAIRTSLDVYGENARKIVPIDSPTFGRVMCVCIGAMMVGTIVTTVKEGDVVQRGDEFGYFAFGGSTIVILFEKGVVEWDEDLVVNGKASLETLVRVASGVGRCVRPVGSA
ncbi:hypothetical protein FRC02_012151, partial [Tulasnella sp. 418]